MNKTLLLAISLLSLPAYTYIGPGMGGGAIAAIIGFFTAIILGLWAILYYPIKRALKKRRLKKVASKHLDNESK